MADVLTRSVSAHEPERSQSEKSHDVAILVSAGLFAAGLIVVLFASGLSAGIEPINLDLVNAYP
jgi:hypothetical protein